MPKRIVDGDALARSDKLGQVEPIDFRSEYAYLLTLALSNGSFECDARKIWSDLYSYNRPDVTPEQVAAMLDEFERVKMLFRWTESSGKVWGHWVGSDKPGRLPAPSRLRNGEKVGAPVPAEKLKAFVACTAPQPDQSASSTAPLPEHHGSSTESLPEQSLGFGFGFGSGSGVREQYANRTVGVNADMAWRGVMDRCGLAGDVIGQTLRDLASMADRAGEDMQAWTDEVVGAYQAYHEAIPDLEISFGAKSFFGDGLWRNRSAWRWKKGRGPAKAQAAEPKFDSVEAKLAQLGAPVGVMP